MEVQQTSDNEADPADDIHNEDLGTANMAETDANTSGNSKGSDVENLDNIKKFIEAQEKDIQYNTDKNVQDSRSNSVENGKQIEKKAKTGNLKTNLENLELFDENVEEPAGSVEKPVQNIDDETMAVASSVMEMILSETEAIVMKSNTMNAIPNQAINPDNSSMPLSVGSKVEAKDFSEEWYAAEIAEVDFDEMEVLVHYETCLKKPDEWISVSSPRLRPFTGIKTPKPEEKPTELIKLLKEIKEEPKDIKAELKSKVFVVGERCLARWRDNRRFVATIDKDLHDGNFQVIFDDGYRWSCPVSRLSKLKDTRDVLTIDTTLPSTSGAPSSSFQEGLSPGSPSPIPTFHTHLFDPTRDYLGSKSERREKKRKLNIKEIFNIGQKKLKVKVENKTPKEKKVVKKTVQQKIVEIKTEKFEIPEAVAAIIGSATSNSDDNTNIEIKQEKQDSTDSMEVNDFDGLHQLEESTDSKSDLDPVDEEDKLERFDKPDQIMHEEVMDKMKEVISKLESGLKEEVEKKNSPNAVRIDSPKLDIKPDIDSPEPVTDKKALDNDTPQPVLLTPKPDVESPTPEAGTIPVTDPTELDIETLTTDIEVLVADVPSPSLIDTEVEFNFEKIAMDDDSTKSDIEMGNESPRLDIDSQPILVDIDAPLDDDPPESVQQEASVSKKPKKLRIKDFEKPKKKMKKEQKKKLLHLKWTEVNQVKHQLAAMNQRMKAMMREIEREKQATEGIPLPESYLLPNEWACRWINGQPAGKVSEIEADAKPDGSGKPALPRRSVEVVDRRLPPGWSKHMVRRSVGHSAGKWDVVLISPTNRRFHTKLDMRNFLETADESVKDYEHCLMDFGVHLKLSRKLGWISSTPDGVAEAPATILPADSNSSLSPLVKRKNLSLNRRSVGLKLKDKVKKRPIKLKLQRRMHTYNSQLIEEEGEMSAANVPQQTLLPALEEGYVWVGSLKVQVIEDLLRCPAEGCFKNFRNNTLLQMHIKHYHRELCKMMGATPKVLDLAAARSKPTLAELNRMERGLKVKVHRPQKREEPTYDNLYPQDQDMIVDVSHTTPTKDELPKVPRSQDSPKLRNMLVTKPVKRPRVLLPMKRSDPDQPPPDFASDDDFEDAESALPPSDVLDFETAISTHTVTKPLGEKKKKGEKKQKSFATFANTVSEDEEWFAMNSDELDTRSSFPRSGTPDDAKIIDPKTGMLLSSDGMDDLLDPPLYTFTDSGERIKIVHMKREEIINCHCGFREEDGLMVQCELCLCWQHALCHNIHRESEVPEKYTCSICVNPRRGRRSRRFVHDQDRMYEGLLAGARPDEALRRSHELSGNLLRAQDALHALRLKHFITTKKDHPKLYLWAKDWEQADIPYKLNSDYSDLSIMINGMDKENLPMKPDDPHLLEMRTGSEDDPDSDRYSQRDAQLGSQALLSGLLSSPSAASLDLPISTSELERLAKSVQEAAAEWQGQSAAPQPEAAIENEVCLERLLKHIQRGQVLLDSRLDSIEAQVAELESQDPSFGEHYETAEHYPRIKQTVQMLMRDLDTMEELGVIT